MRLSAAAAGLETSLTRQLFNRATELEDVIDLTLGDPDLTPVQPIRDAAKTAIQEGKTHYSVNAGLAKAREAIAKSLKKEMNLSVDPDTELMLTVGGMGALYLSLSALVNPGDEVLLIGPCYVNYVQMIHMRGGNPVIVYTDPEENFRIHPEKLEKAITEKTVALVLNSPCNPTGGVIDGETLNELAELARRHDLAVVSDEVYKTLLFDGAAYESIITRPGMKERTILIDSMSKRFSMTGYRCGYAVGPAEVIGAMTKMQENTASCTPLPSQYAAIEAYSNHLEEHWIRDEFETRRNYIAQAINGISGLSCRKPAGTFYLFVNIEGTGMDSVRFADALLEDQHVAVVPGVTYGAPYGGYIRIAFTQKPDVLREAAERIRRFAEKQGKNTEETKE